MSARVRVLIPLLVPLTLSLSPLGGERDSGGLGPCANRGTSIQVDTRERTLFLCEAGEAQARFPVALGVGGVGKRREGDGRTPLGAYPLGAPRPSQGYGTFIPVGYPTPAQARDGLTGGAIGIHGPPRAFAGAGRLNTVTDWTAGCVAVGSDAEIERIAAWVRARRGAGVRIE